MTQRLVWNFEFTTPKNSALSGLKIRKEDDLKWEARFFWPASEVISLSLLDDSLLDLAHYQQKQKQDQYYLIPKHNYNLKNRRGELLYKPLVKQSKYVLGFGAKINISALDKSSSCPFHPEFDAKKVLSKLENSPEIVVKKNSFTYKFSLQPSIKLELARIDVNNHIYFSLCVEGKSRDLVECVSFGLLGKIPSSDYVSFLKKITQNK
jgi:hypothetical protein